jgi:hypothetical protein
VTLRQIFALFMLITVASGVSFAGDKPSKPIKPVLTRFASMTDEDPKLVVRVKQAIHAKDYAGGFAKLMLEQVEYRVPAGDYPVRYHTFAEGREWYLVPIQKWVAGSRTSETRTSSVVSGCPSRFTDYLTIDRATMQVEPYGFEIVEHTCSERGFKRVGSWDGPLVVLKPGEIAVVNQAVIDAERQAQVDAEAAQLNASKAEEAKLTPLKKKIGTKLCQVKGRFHYFGYTEAVSPDLDRIQIRVSGATDGPPSNRSVDDFREQILWDDPVNWQLCE